MRFFCVCRVHFIVPSLTFHVKNDMIKTVCVFVRRTFNRSRKVREYETKGKKILIFL